MIRTDYVRLKKLNAVAYRQKLKAGGSGIVIIQKGVKQPGIAQIDKRESRPILQANINEKLYPIEAFEEAIELTIGMPYGKRKPVRFPAELLEKKPVETMDDPVEIEDDENVDYDENIEDEQVVDSRAYQAIVSQFTDKKGKLSYLLLNRDFIKFAKKSSFVQKMVDDLATNEEILHFIVLNRLIEITKDKNLTLEQMKAIVNLLDEVSPKFVFKELNDEIRKLQSRHF
jgi:hypothetical protein